VAANRVAGAVNLLGEAAEQKKRILGFACLLMVTWYTSKGVWPVKAEAGSKMRGGADGGHHA
jgi:hypothetical protein